MLRKFIRRWQSRPGGAGIEQQVEEELRFHCEMLTQEYEETGLSEEAARDATRRRFGNVERVQAECVEISRRNKPMMKLLKLVLLLSFITGVWLRTRGWAVQFTQMGDLLMATAMLGQLLLYVKGLRPTGYPAVKRSPPFSILGRSEAPSMEAYDELGRTPVERLVADKAHKDS
jgi:hypothetical protein